MTKLLQPAACGSVQKLIDGRLEEVGGRMKGLPHVHQVLRASLSECRGHEKSGRCKVVDDLSARSKLSR